MDDATIEAAVIADLDALGADYDVMDCDPALADTAAFCEAYGIDPEDSANCILVASRRPEGIMALCLGLATDRLDVNGAIRRHLGVRKISFAPAELTTEVTGQIIGGVTPFGTPADLPILVDEGVLARERVVVGGGSRSKKIQLAPDVFGRWDRVTVAPFAQG
jgi:prolyl-tRNA editing enzyme YbaK/EbsC (Cys-tRNA(Pro) deacylase)